jgi:hypothetical protein
MSEVTTAEREAAEQRVEAELEAEREARVQRAIEAEREKVRLEAERRAAAELHAKREKTAAKLAARRHELRERVDAKLDELVLILQALATVRREQQDLGRLLDDIPRDLLPECYAIVGRLKYESGVRELERLLPVVESVQRVRVADVDSRGGTR